MFWLLFAYFQGTHKYLGTKQLKYGSSDKQGDWFADIPFKRKRLGVASNSTLLDTTEAVFLFNIIILEGYCIWSCKLFKVEKQQDIKTTDISSMIYIYCLSL